MKELKIAQDFVCRKVEFSTMPLELAREIDQSYQTYLTPYKANVAVVNVTSTLT